MDLNHRPLPYQGSALTKLSYRPGDRRKIPQRRRPLPIGSGEAFETIEELLLFGERELDATDQVGGDVVEVRAERGERGDHDDVDQSDDRGHAEHAGQREERLDVEAGGAL